MGFKNKLDDTHYVLPYPREHHQKRITIGELRSMLRDTHERTKCQYCGQWGDARSECGHCGAPIDETKTIVNHNFEGSLYGYPLSECIEVTSASIAHKEFLLPNGNVVKVPRLLFAGYP